ncbi:MAG: hypothetical protein HC922_03070 [Leptolyngbyaceae cyanobacterium SM2_3_12]|nr:hypothetical protein [Leptolyngbyaceae cyanobacterium SM2_3_12]
MIDPLAKIWQTPPDLGADPVVRTAQYFRAMRDLAVKADWIALAETNPQPLLALTWIGQNIHRINQRLDDLLRDLLTCFNPNQRPQVQVFAAPIAPRARVDGFCNFSIQPITLIIDPSRILAADWLYLVAHELAHGVVATAGHGPLFHQAMVHLCLAHDLPLPPPDCLETGVLKYWPPYRANPQADEFWLGAAGS